MKKTFWVLSDIHFQGKGKGDELGEDGRKALREFLEPLSPKSLVPNGDILDLLRAPLAEIEKDDEELLALLFSKAYRYVIGNHDRAAINFLDQKYRGVPIVDKLMIGNVMIYHGNIHDIVNSQGHVFGDTITRVVDWLADRIPNVMRVARKLESWARKVGRFGSPATYRKLSIEYIRGIEANEVMPKTVILGHTHRSDRFEQDGFVYLNSGTWINGKKDFVKIEVDA